MKKKKRTLPKKIVAVSGGFDPVHIGHLRMFEAARKLGDQLVVIQNNDNWLQDKKGFVFMNERERKEILLAFSCVDRVMVTSHKRGDSDRSVCRELKRLRPAIFANGGDRKKTNTPEGALCKELGIRMAFNVGGGKIQSSSSLVKKAKRRGGKNNSKLY